jgi:hypothetical protein
MMVVGVMLLVVGIGELVMESDWMVGEAAG